jgi:hypothetical protein
MAIIPLSDLQTGSELHLERSYDERRQMPRLPVRALTLWLNGVAYPGRGDVSVGGAFWKGPGPLVADSEVTLGLRLPGLQGEVLVQADVCRVRSVGEWSALHARFKALPPHVEEALAAYVEDWFLIADVSGVLA